MTAAQRDPTLVWQAVVSLLGVNAAHDGDLSDEWRALVRHVLPTSREPLTTSAVL